MSDLSRSLPINMQAVRMIQQEAKEQLALQVESEEDLNQYFELSLFNPLAQSQRFKDLRKLQESVRKEGQKAEKKEEDQKTAPVQKIEQLASRFERENFELNAKTLQILLSQLKASDSPEELLAKIFLVYPDPALAAEVLEFLMQAADPYLKEALQKAKEKLYQERKREIQAGRNMGAMARQFSKEGLGSPTFLRDLYREITGNPREPLALFDELATQFSYTKLKPMISFLLHALGKDLKAKGPSIPRAQLKRLLDETRSLQGMLSLFRFFQMRMPLIKRNFSQSDLNMPRRVDFEWMTKILIKLLVERYMNAEKVLQTAQIFEIEQEKLAQIVVFNQLLEGLKQMPARYFRNFKHREELTRAFLDCLDQLEKEKKEKDESS